MAPECSPAAFEWDALLDSLQSATLAGKDNVLGCTLVKAEYAAPATLPGRYVPTYRFEIPLWVFRAPDRWLQMIGDLPVLNCSGSSPSVGCVKISFQ